MKKTYAIKIMPPENGEKTYLVYIPDWDIYTQGETIEDCLDMAKDAIGLMGIDYEDDKKNIPQPSTLKLECAENEIPALVDVDFAAYRTKNENRMVRKNCTIPAWLEKEADLRKINYSAVLQEALKNIIVG